MSDDGPGAREVAYRLFAAEFDDASLSYSESDEERAPNYVVTPTGARVNRLFVAGVLTEIERVNDETRRGRVVDPSGAFVTYAGQYQPEAQTFLERAEPPEFVALTGKARTFEPEDSDRVFTSVRPESLNEVDADTRNRWVVTAAEATLDRLAVFAVALDSDLRGDDLRAALEAGGAPAPLAAGIPKALDHYGTTAAYAEAVRRLAVDALELVAGDRDEVRPLDIAPDEGEQTALGPLPETDVTIAEPAAVDAEPITDSDAADADDLEGTVDDSEEGGPDSDLEPTVDSESTADVEPTAGRESTADAGSATDSGSTADAESVSEPEAATNESAETAVGAATDSEPAVEESEPLADADAPDSATDDGGGLGDFDAGADEGGPSGADAGADSDGDDMYQLDDEEREEIESEFGTDFSTGTEVDEPGEADIDVPEPEEMAEEPDRGADPTASDAADPAGDEEAAEPAAETADASDDAEAEADGEDVDLEAASVEAMSDLDDGDGAPRQAVVERVADDHGVDPEAVEDAIQDALMSGQCYEPGDGLLKPI
ncbi:hypothetical protein ABNG02_12590 [Halorubrum ejinorense]|uniref:Rpa-associated protein n=1 Tax=Halorubrum ejinorense TaxID=425309 RepID=A0AAV3SQZ6_9EURY